MQLTLPRCLGEEYQSGVPLPSPHIYSKKGMWVLHPSCIQSSREIVSEYVQGRERGRENEDVFFEHGFEGHLPMVIIMVLEAGSTFCHRSRLYLKKLLNSVFFPFPSVLESQTSCLCASSHYFRNPFCAGSQTVGRLFTDQRSSWRPTLVLLPGKSHGRRSLVGCSPWGHEESDTTERLHFHFSLSWIGEGNGNPLQCSCLENPRDNGACLAAVYGVTQSRT